MSSIPVLTPDLTPPTNAGSAHASAIQTVNAQTEQTNTPQDMVTLSNGVQQPTPAEEAGLFQIAVASYSVAQLNVQQAQTNDNAESNGGNSTATPFPANVTAAASPAPGNNAAVQAQTAAAAPATDANAATTALATAAATTANAGGANAAAAQTQAAPATTTATPPADQNLITQFLNYLSQLGLSPQSQNTMKETAEMLEQLDPQGFQDLIAALRAQASALLAPATNSIAAAAITNPAQTNAASAGGGSAQAGAGKSAATGQA
ncbi:MAG: hypothetical protein WA755_12450 [Candidatus Acidiferrales bacterium]